MMKNVKKFLMLLGLSVGLNSNCIYSSSSCTAMVEEIVAEIEDINEDISGGFRPMYLDEMGDFNKDYPELALMFTEKGLDFKNFMIDGLRAQGKKHKDGRIQIRPTDIDDVISVAEEINNKLGRTFLHYAVDKGLIKMVQALIDAGSDVNTVDKPEEERMRTTPLLLLLLKYDFNKLNSFNDILKLLIKKGADVNFSDNQIRWTPLRLAVHRSNQNAVKLLIEAGADETIFDTAGYDAFYFANESMRDVIRQAHADRDRQLVEAGY